MDTSNNTFQTGMPTKPFRRGDAIEILPEFQDAGDDIYAWVVVGDEEKGRVDITPSNIDLHYKPVYVVTIDQIKHKNSETELKHQL